MVLSLCLEASPAARTIMVLSFKGSGAEMLKLVTSPWADLSQEFHVLIGHHAQKQV